jgi:hypothetical protein
LAVAVACAAVREGRVAVAAGVTALFGCGETGVGGRVGWQLPMKRDIITGTIR